MGPRRAAQALAVALVALAVCAAGQASDISLSGVEVALLESGGSVAASHALSGPAKLELVLDHTRTLKVSADGAGWRRRAAAAATAGGLPLSGRSLRSGLLPLRLLHHHSSPRRRRRPPARDRCRCGRRSRAATPASGRSRSCCG